MHRRAVAVLVVVAEIASPALAQRDGSLGESGGIASHGAPVYSSYAAVGRNGSLSTAQYSRVGTPQSVANSYAGLGSNQMLSKRPNPVDDHGRHSPDNRNDRDRLDHDRDDRYHGFDAPLYGVGTTYYSIGWVGPNDLGRTAPDFYVDLANPAPQRPPAIPVAEYEAPPVRPSPQPSYSSQAMPAAVYDAPPVRQAAARPSTAYRPAYERPQPPPEAATEASVTLIFKDGRPSEEIHNYMLTRTTLYVQEQRLREIPVDQLDLAATMKLNRDAGVDFRLPGESR